MATTLTGTSKKRRIELATAPVDWGLQDPIDRWLVGGCLLIGTFVLAPVGLVLLWKGFSMHRDARRRGATLRPGIITVLAIICIVDAAINYLMWCIDFFPAHDTVLGQSLMTGFGRLWDGAYYLGYNTTPLGGTPLASEKCLEFAGVLMMYPMRLASAWGFMKLKKWGFQFFVISSYIYVFWWVAYMAQFTMGASFRLQSTTWGVTGWWIINVIYITPFFMIPFLHTVNRDLWTSEEPTPAPT